MAAVAVCGEHRPDRVERAAANRGQDEGGDHQPINACLRRHQRQQHKTDCPRHPARAQQAPAAPVGQQAEKRLAERAQQRGNAEDGADLHGA